LDDFSEILDDFSEILDDFSEILDDFSDILDDFSEILDDFSEILDDSPTAECFGVFSHSKGFGADRSSSKTDSLKVPRFQVQVPSTGSQVKVPK